MSSSRDRDRYGRPAFRRVALAPGLLAAVALVVGIGLLETGTFTVFRYIASIFALIVLVFAYRARHWWWVPVMLAIAVLWNPVLPLPFAGPLWLGAQYLAVLAFVLAGVLIKVPATDEDQRR